MPITGKLKRSALGKVLRTAAGLLRRCGCCTPDGGCSHAIFARVCYRETDEHCDIIDQPGFWICSDALCSNGKTSVGDQFIRLGARCYFVDPETVTRVEDLPEGTEVNDGAYSDCSIAGCDDPACPARPQVCPCLCFSYKVVGGEPQLDCCFGRKDHDGNLPSLDFTYTVVHQEYVQRTKKDNGQLNIHCVDDDCINSRSCVYYAYSGVTTDVLTRGGCGVGKNGTITYTVDKRGTIPGLGLVGCCTIPNNPHAPTTGFLMSVSVYGSYEEGIFSEPETTTVDEFDYGGSPGGTCTGGARITTTKSRSCTARHREVVEESWSWSSDGAEDCQCQEYLRVTHTEDWAYSGVGDTTLCNQCDAELRA